MLSDPKHTPFLTDEEIGLLREHIEEFLWNIETGQTRHELCDWTTPPNIQTRPVRRTLVNHLHVCTVLNPTTKDTDDMTTDAHKDAARFLRELADDGMREFTERFRLPTADAKRLAEIAELLDPTPKSTLRGDIKRAFYVGDDDDETIDAILSVVSRHITDLPKDALIYNSRSSGEPTMQPALSTILDLLKPQESK